MTWTMKIHRMLVLWLGQISHSYEAHQAASARAANLNGKLLISVIVISALSSFGSFVNISEFEEIVRKIIAVIVGVLAMIVVILTGIISEMKLGEVSQRHAQAAAEYVDISALIQTTAVAPVKPSAEQFLQRILDRISIIQRYSPDLPEDVGSIADLPNLILSKSAMVESKKQTIADLDVIKKSDDQLFMPSASSGELQEVHITEEDSQ